MHLLKHQKKLFSVNTANSNGNIYKQCLSLVKEDMENVRNALWKEY